MYVIWKCSYCNNLLSFQWIVSYFYTYQTILLSPSSTRTLHPPLTIWCPQYGISKYYFKPVLTSAWTCHISLERWVPFRRERDAASSRGWYGNALSVTGLWSMNKNTQCTLHWQVEAYDVSKWASAGIKRCLWNTSSSFFLSSGDFVFWSVSNYVCWETL